MGVGGARAKCRRLKCCASQERSGCWCAMLRALAQRARAASLGLKVGTCVAASCDSPRRSTGLRRLFWRPWRPVCRTYNLTLRANQVLPRCPSQNSCKLVAECSLCLARAHESCAANQGFGRHQGTGSGTGASASGGSRALDCRKSCPFVRKQTQPMSCLPAWSRADLWLRIVAVLIAVAQILRRVHGVALWKVGACVSILMKNVRYSVGRSRRLAPVRLTLFEGNLSSEDTRRWSRRALTQFRAPRRSAVARNKLADSPLHTSAART